VKSRIWRRIGIALGLLAALFVGLLIWNGGQFQSAFEMWAATVWIGGIALIGVYSIVTKTLARRREVIKILEEARKEKEAGRIGPSRRESK
jgi:hypothetical protein